MTYRQTLDYLYTQLPMFHRIGSAAYKANLDNTTAICRLLGNPEKKFRSVHVGGTNGKGSVSHMLAAILQCAGYKTGLYTSPHLKDFRERISINGKMIPKKYIVDFVTQHQDAFEQIRPSFFEWTVGLAFDYFAKEEVDIAFIEVGLGGRLDSTNVITPLLSIITNTSYDHQNLLGDTLQKIAVEKAGIIKPNGIAIIGETQKEVKNIFEEAAVKNNSALVFSDQIYSVKNIRQKSFSGKIKTIFDLHSSYQEKAAEKNFLCALSGRYQAKNIPAVLAAVFLLNAEYGFRISAQAIRKGFSSVDEITGLAGRWQVLSKNPLTVADIAHNESGIKQVFKQVKITPHQMLHVVFGVVKDKDISPVIELLPKKARYYFCRANIPRALDENELKNIAGKSGLQGECFASVRSALKAAKKKAKKNDMVLITGSAFVIAEVL